MRGLFKRGKVYWIDYRVNGKRYRESTGTTLRREAEYIYACRKKDAKEGKIPEIKKIKKDYSFMELTENYLKWAQRQRSYKAKKYMIAQLIDVFGTLNVNDLNTRIIEQWQSKRMKRNKPSTVNRILATLKHMVNKGVQWEMATDDTLRQVRNVKLLPENNKRLRFLTIEECQTLIDCCQPHLRPIVMTAMHTGMRRGEIFGLEWKHVDLKHGFILLEQTKNGERREIPINTTLEYLFKEMPHSIESVYVFTGKDGNPLTDIKKSFHAAMKKAGIYDFRFHDLRHTFASHLVMQGVDLASVKELLGHKSITMTMRYAHLAPGHKRKAVNLFDKLLTDNQWVDCDQNVTKTYQKESKLAV